MTRWFDERILALIDARPDANVTSAGDELRIGGMELYFGVRSGDDFFVVTEYQRDAPGHRLTSNNPRVLNGFLLVNRALPSELGLEFDLRARALARSIDGVEVRRSDDGHHISWAEGTWAITTSSTDAKMLPYLGATEVDRIAQEVGFDIDEAVRSMAGRRSRDP